jgi:hypothetical protein
MYGELSRLGFMQHNDTTGLGRFKAVFQENSVRFIEKKNL